jgi:peptidoglycan/LPS O-acetylase OafA/YrhL
MVLVHHTNEPYMITSFRYLACAVDGFFLMSGWLNSLSMESTYEGSKDSDSAIKSFIIHRGFRILPVYYIVIVLVQVLRGPAGREICNKSFFFHVLFLQNFKGQECWVYTWSLVVEIQLYLLIPLITKFFMQSKLKGWLFISALALFFLMTTIFNEMFYIIHFSQSTQKRRINFLLGIAFHHLTRYLEERGSTPSNR